MNSQRLWAAMVLVTLMVAGLPIIAQTTGGSLEGRVVDQTGQPVLGALVQVAGPSLQGYEGGATDSSGQYTIPFLPPGSDYQVTVEASGLNKVIRKGITIPLGATVYLPFTLSPGQTEITVTAAASMVDPKTSKGGATLSDKMIQAIPLQRDANQIVFLAPGAVDGGSSTPGMASILGSTGAENTYLVNGVDVTNTDYGTGTGATGCIPCTQSGPIVVAGAVMGSMINFDFIQDQQVMAGGVPPEYGWAMGGVVNSITKSGGNEFRGGLFAYYWSDALQAKSKTYPYSSTFEGNGGYTRYDVGANLSGYFIKDKLWFYLGYDYNRMKQYTDVPDGPGFGDSMLYLDGRPAQSAYAGRRIRDTSEINQQYAFNVTWNVSPSHKLSFVVFGNQDKTDRLRTLASLAPESMSSSEKTQPTSVSLQWNATWAPRFFTEAVASYRSNTQKTTLTPEGASSLAYHYYFSGFYALPKDQFSPPASISPGNVVDLGSNYQASLGYGGYVGIDEDTSRQVRFKGTNLFGGAGRHELSYGLQYDDRRYTPFYGTSGPKDFVSPGLGRVATGGLGVVAWYPASLFGWPDGPDGQKYIYRVDEGFSGMTAPTAMRTWAAWINDNWSLTDYATLKLGLRYDEERVEGRLPGGQSIDLTGNYAPRVGFSWDVAHNSKGKLYGFAGRYFQRVPTEIAVRALNSYASGREWFYDPQLTVLQRPSVLYPEFKVQIQGQTPGLPVESPLKAPYTDEVLLGFDYEVLPDLRLGTRLIYRALGRTIDDLSFDLANTFVIANPGDWTHLPTPGTDGGTYYIAKPIRIYRALEITLDKRWSHNWQLGASYVLSRLEGNYEGGVVNDVPRPALLPNIGPSYDIPETMVNTYGRLPLDRTHVLKVYGSYQFSSVPLLLSGNFLLQSGTPISRHMDYGWYGTTGFAQPRGSSGRTPTTWKLDLGVEYAFWLPKNNYLGLRLDVFNVTNNQATTGVYQDWQYQDSPRGPVVMNNALWSKPYAHQAPRTARFALRWVF
jgi:hypothetical protein